MTANPTNYNQKQPEVSTFYNLTEKWKKGELPEGDYYIERRNGYLLYDNIDSHGVWRNSIDEDIVEVLAPVPSYDHFVELTEKVKENQKLKEMLYKCREKLDWLNGGYDVWGGELTDFIEEIDEVLK